MLHDVGDRREHALVSAQRICEQGRKQHDPACQQRQHGGHSGGLASPGSDGVGVGHGTSLRQCSGSALLQGSAVGKESRLAWANRNNPCSVMRGD